MSHKDLRLYRGDAMRQGMEFGDRHVLGCTKNSLLHKAFGVLKGRDTSIQVALCCLHFRQDHHSLSRMVDMAPLLTELDATLHILCCTSQVIPLIQQFTEIDVCLACGGPGKLNTSFLSEGKRLAIYSFGFTQESLVSSETGEGTHRSDRCSEIADCTVKCDCPGIERSCSSRVVLLRSVCKVKHNLGNPVA